MSTGYGRVQLKCVDTRWRTGGEVKGETGEWSGYPVLFTLPRNMVYPELLPLMRTTRLPVVDWTDGPRRLKWTCPLRRKTKSGFCACAITFQTQSNQRNGLSWILTLEIQIFYKMHLFRVPNYGSSMHNVKEDKVGFRLARRRDMPETSDDFEWSESYR